MSAEGIDYAWGRPSLAALLAAGKTFVCRYLSHSPSKNLTAAEARGLSEAGVWIVAVWETTAKRALDGKAAGTTDARDALSQAQVCGMPDGRPIYFAVDWDATVSQQSAINAYLDGAASVLGRDRVGIYGGYGPVSRALAVGKARWAWQTYAWSGGRWAAGVHLQQYSNGHTLGGVGCDYNRAMTSDYGQWRVGVSPEGEDDMAQVSSLGVDGAQVIKAGKTADAKWTEEYTDKHGLHGDGGTSVAIAKESLWAVLDAEFTFAGLAQGDAVEVAWVRVKDDGTFIDNGWGPFTYIADAQGVVHGEIGGQFGLNDSNRLRLRIHNTSEKDLTVVAAGADGKPVTMAKASLFRY
ncbi:DUF1906 domain-containing protein [Actinoallomurus sp. CA-142502]|uniref:DUF1906 domain-containing protein n=1 Tax=Actinoallomurus sp. CA-142502 TaxID=3239885 RepID=UPI003D8BC178